MGCFPKAPLSTSRTKAVNPASVDSRGPATFRVSMKCSSMKAFKRVSGLVELSSAITKQGRRHLEANFFVNFVPPVISGLFENKTVPSLSRTFHSVRWEYPSPGVSSRGKRPSMGPSSAILPAGHQPPHSIPASSAHSSAARSTPVWPPDTIFFSIKGMTKKG